MAFGAALEDVWGDSMVMELPQQPRKNDKKQSDVCEIYAQSKKLDDIMNYFEKKGDVYDKVPTSRTQETLPETEGTDRGDSVVTSRKAIDLPEERRMVYEGFEQHQRRERDYIDFALYVFSGVVLIFVMEQFIQIGINLQRRLN